MSDPGEITEILNRVADGDSGAFEELMPKVYAELRALAGHFMGAERRDHTLQPTELVHEVYLRLVGQTEVEFTIQDQTGQAHSVTDMIDTP